MSNEEKSGLRIPPQPIMLGAMVYRPYEKGEGAMASMSDPVRLSESQSTAAAVLLSRAFREDAGIVYVIPEMVQRSRDLPFLFAPIVRYTLAHGEGYTTGDTLEAVALWLPPGETAPTNEGMEQAGIGDTAQGLDAEIMGRLGTLMAYRETLHAQVMPEPHWRLLFLGVEPERQDQGIGGALIQPMLARMEAAGEPCYLETLEARSVPFYERHGFRVVTEGDLPDSAVHVWAMRRG
jgi:ribosomal protein S18 acetylase RimI-like enzyme